MAIRTRGLELLQAHQPPRTSELVTAAAAEGLILFGEVLAAVRRMIEHDGCAARVGVALELRVIAREAREALRVTDLALRIGELHE